MDSLPKELVNIVFDTLHGTVEYWKKQHDRVLGEITRRHDSNRRNILAYYDRLFYSLNKREYRRKFLWVTEKQRFWAMRQFRDLFETL